MAVSGNTAQSSISAAIGRYASETCISFVEDSQNIQSNYINVIKGNGCWSYIGDVFGGDPQDLSLGTNCANVKLQEYD